MADIIPVILSFQYYSSMFNMKGTGDDVYSYCDIVRKGSIFNTKTLKCFNTLKTTIYIYIISVGEIYLKKNISIAFLLISRDYNFCISYIGNVTTLVHFVISDQF